MQRIFRITSIVIITVLIVAVAAYAAKTPKVYLCCETYSVRSLMGEGEGKYTPITVMKLMKEMGMKGVALNDIWMKSYDKSYLDQIKKAAKENGIIIAALICEGNLATDDEEARKRQIEVNKMKLRAAGYLGAKVVRFDLGGTGDPVRDGTVGVQRVIDAFNQLIPLAKEMNVKITIENHGGVSKKADWIIQIIKGTDPKWVGSCLDFKNWPKDILYEENAKLAPYAYHTHAKAHSFNAQGEEESVEFGRILKMLKDAKYKGAISIEYEGGGDEVAGVKKTRDLILKYWKM